MRYALIALFLLPLPAAAAGLPGRDAIIVRPDEEGLAGDADAASQGTIDDEQLAPRPLLRPGEVLEVIPGLVVTQHSGTGKANQYFLRGFNLDHGTDFAVHVDGMPLNLPSHGHGQGYADLNFLIPEMVEHIHYRKGPYYADEGDFSAAGAAHVHLKRSTEAPFAELKAGSFGYRRGLFGASQALEGGALLGMLEVGEDDGPWENPERLRKLNGVLRYAAGDDRNGLTVTGMAYSSRWNATDQIPLRAVESGMLARFAAVDPSDGGRASRYSLSTQWARSDASTSTRVSAYLFRSDLSLFSNFTYFLNDPIHGDQFQQLDRRTVAGGEASHTWRTVLGGRELEHTGGVQLRNDVIPQVALRNTQARQVLSTVRDDSVRQTSAGIYYVNSASWTPWMRTLAGLRADGYRFRVDSDNPQNSGMASASLVSPKLGLVLGPWSDVEYFVNYGHGFHSNDARGATISVDPSSGAPVERVSPLVRAKGGEVGLRAAPRKGLQTSIALWRLDIDSELLFVGDAGSTEPAEPSRRHRVGQLLQALRTHHGRLRRHAFPGAVQGRRSGRRLHSGRCGAHGFRRHLVPGRAVERRPALALLRPAAADRGQRAALELLDPGECQARLCGRQENEGRTGSAECLRSQGGRHRLLLRIAPRRRGRPGRRQALSSRRAALAAALPYHRAVNRFAVASALAAAFLFGASTPAAKALAGNLHPVLLAGLLYAGSGIGLALWASLGRRRTGLRRADLPWLAGAIACGGVLGPVLLMFGLAATSAANASLLLNLEGVFTALLAWFAFRENFDRRIALGMALIVAGGALLAFSPDAAGGAYAGSAAIAGACLAWGIDNNLTRRISSADATWIAALKGLVAGSVNLAIALAVGASWPGAGRAAAALATGFLGYGMSLALFVVALRELGAARTGAYFSAAPLAGVLIALLVLGESTGALFWPAAALIAAGIWLHLTEHHEHQHEHEPMEHEHPHVHDAHHRHDHVGGWDGTQPHTHLHRHVRLVHRHPHYPDIHHRHH